MYGGLDYEAGGGGVWIACAAGGIGLTILSRPDDEPKALIFLSFFLLFFLERWTMYFLLSKHVLVFISTSTYLINGHWRSSPEFCLHHQ